MPNPRFLGSQPPWAPALASPLVPSLFATSRSPSRYLSGARVLKVTSCAGGKAERGAEPHGGGEPNRGLLCPMGEMDVGARMLGEGKRLVGPRGLVPRERGRMAARTEGRAGPARFRPCARPPACLLFKRLPPSLRSRSLRSAHSFPAFLISPAPLGFRGHPAAPAQVPWPLCTAPACGE